MIPVMMNDLAQLNISKSQDMMNDRFTSFLALSTIMIWNMYVKNH